MAAHTKTKLKLRVDFDGRQHPVHPNSEETAGELKAEAITFFRFVGDPNTLGLFRACPQGSKPPTPIVVRGGDLTHDFTAVVSGS